MNVSLRDALTTDAIAISELVSSEVRKHIAPLLGAGGLETLLASLDVDSTYRRIADGWLHVVAKDDRGVLVGGVVVKPPSHLYHLFVHSDLQRGGIGRRLFKAADDRVYRSTGSRLATVNASPNAVGVYERFGFVAAG